MNALFVHDHKFPKNENRYFYSYGFDEEFFGRYLDIFQNFNVLSRETHIASPTSKKLVLENVEFLTFRNYKELYTKKFQNQIENLLKKVDCAVVRLPSITGNYILPKLKKLNIPYIIEVVGHAWDSLIHQKFPGKLLAPLLHLGTKKEVKRASHVVYVTNEYLQKTYPTAGKSIGISNVTLNEVPEEKLNESLNNIRMLNVKELILGTCGSLSYYKGQQNVIKALPELNELGYTIQYEIVGGGDSSYLKRIAEDYGVLDQVIFKGELSHEEVFEWIDTIDLYIQPSLTEGLPRTVIESMSRSCPTIGSKAGGIPELVNTKYLFAKDDSEEIIKVIRSLDKEDLRKMAIENHYKSKKYLKENLYSNRKKFFSSFINEEVL